MAGLPFQDLKTASVASLSCSIGSCGKSKPLCLLIMALNASVSAFQSSAFNSVSSEMPLCCLRAAMACSNSSSSMSSTTEPNIWTKRLYEL